MTQEHPITPPDELVNLLRYEAPLGIRDGGVTRELHLITAAYRAGADQQLEACIHWLLLNGWGQAINGLRAACRPKPKSQVEEALDLLDRIEYNHMTKNLGNEKAWDIKELEAVRAALERLRELEKSND
jgi:hypothetical protein